MPTRAHALDPFLQFLRRSPGGPAWLPVAMILFGLGAKSAFALVCSAPSSHPAHSRLRVRSVDPKLCRGGLDSGLSRNAHFLKLCCRRRRPRSHLPEAWAWPPPGSSSWFGEMTGVAAGLGRVIMESHAVRAPTGDRRLIVIGVAGLPSRPRARADRTGGAAL